MHKFDSIFETLKDLRTYTEDQNMPITLRTVERAEHIALNEICGVYLTEGGDDYASVMAKVFPSMGKESK